MPEISKEAFEKVKKVIPIVKRRHAHAGRKRDGLYRVLNAIIYILRNNIPWTSLPQSLRYGTGITAYRRVAEWRAQKGKQGTVWDDITTVLKPYHPDVDFKRPITDRRYPRIHYNGKIISYKNLSDKEK